MGARPLPRTAIGLPRPAGSLARSFAEPPLRAVEWLLGLSGIEAAAQRVERGLATNGALGEVMLESTGVRAVVDARELAQIPARGGAVLCSNHPFGGADAITLIALALRRRSDVKVLANGILRRLPFMADHCIFVDPFGGTDAARANAAALRDALAWLRDGHLLIVFPAGEVSAIAWGRWTPADPPWSVIPFRLAQKTNARIVPAWCDGCNRTIFHAAGLLHPRLRTALLLGEFVARFGREVHFRIGAPFDANDGGLAPEELARLAKDMIAPQEIEKKRIEIAAAAEAEKRRIEAKGEADAVMLKFQAEAEGVRSVLEAKADGYRRLIESCGSNPQVGPTLLLIEQLPQLVAEQVKAISALKIDKITVWDTGTTRDGRNTTSDFLAGMVNSLPRLHELARQAGIQLPAALGKVDENASGVIDGACEAKPAKDE